MHRRLFVIVAPRLMESLTEQFEALGGHELIAVDPGACVAPPWPDAILLDAPACDALGLAGGLRAAGFAGAIVMIGATSPEADAALERPFRFADLLAALEAPPRPTEAAPVFGARLTEKEAAILDRLMAARGAIVSRDALLADVWGYGPNVSTRTLETHIHRLRRKIEAEPARPQRLITEAQGYRLAGVRE